MFGRNKKKAAAPALVIRDPLAVVPRFLPQVQAKPDKHGVLQLRQEILIKGVHSRVKRWLGMNCSRTLVLDEHGTRYFKLVDGTKTLREIGNEMMTILGGDRASVEKAVLLFTKQLMQKGLLVLQVTPENQVRRPS
ncbi:MAG: PqqD family peptide modification chaperone [bacterium]